MRKLFVILLALILSIIMIVPVALPVSAASPNDNKPVAWVSWGGSDANSKDVRGVHDVQQTMVKLLSDGNTIGRIFSRNFTTGEETIWDVLGSNFYLASNSAKVADVLAQSTNFGPIYFCWRLKDYGEPGKDSDSYTLLIWYENGFPTFPPDAPLPYFTYFPLPTVPGWYTIVPETILVGSNIQVHLPRD